MSLKFICMYWIMVCVFAAPPIDEVPPHRQQPTVIPIVSLSAEYEADGKFKYSYETGNGIKREETAYDKEPPQSKSNTDSSNEGGEEDESDEIHVQKGSYSYTAPDGTIVSVRYIADENGFQPIITEQTHSETPPTSKTSQNREESNKSESTKFNKMDSSNEGKINQKSKINSAVISSSNTNPDSSKKFEQLNQEPEVLLSPLRFGDKLLKNSTKPIDKNSKTKILPAKPIDTLSANNKLSLNEINSSPKIETTPTENKNDNNNNTKIEDQKSDNNKDIFDIGNEHLDDEETKITNEPEKIKNKENIPLTEGEKKKRKDSHIANDKNKSDEKDKKNTSPYNTDSNKEEHITEEIQNQDKNKTSNTIESIPNNKTEESDKTKQDQKSEENLNASSSTGEKSNYKKQLDNSLRNENIPDIMFDLNYNKTNNEDGIDESKDIDPKNINQKSDSKEEFPSPGTLTGIVENSTNNDVNPANSDTKPTIEEPDIKNRMIVNNNDEYQGDKRNISTSNKDNKSVNGSSNMEKIPGQEEELPMKNKNNAISQGIKNDTYNMKPDEVGNKSNTTTQKPAQDIKQLTSLDMKDTKENNEELLITKPGMEEEYKANEHGQNKNKSYTDHDNDGVNVENKHLLSKNNNTSNNIGNASAGTEKLLNNESFPIINNDKLDNNIELKQNNLDKPENLNPEMEPSDPNLKNLSKQLQKPINEAEKNEKAAEHAAETAAKAADVAESAADTAHKAAKETEEIANAVKSGNQSPQAAIDAAKKHAKLAGKAAKEAEKAAEMAKDAAADAKIAAEAAENALQLVQSSSNTTNTKNIPKIGSIAEDAKSSDEKQVKNSSAT